MTSMPSDPAPAALTVDHLLALPCGHDLAVPPGASTPCLSVLILAHQVRCAEGEERPDGSAGTSVLNPASWSGRDRGRRESSRTGYA